MKTSKPKETVEDKNEPMEITQPSTSKEERLEKKPAPAISSDRDDSVPSHRESTRKKKKCYKQKFTESWLKDQKFNTWLIKNPRQQYEPFCMLCSKAIMGGISHINRHAATTLHKKKEKSAKATPRVTEFYNKKKDEKIAVQVKAAELKMVAFIAEHNLAFSVLDHLPKLIASICPDSEIARRVKLDRKKGTKICKEVMKREHLFVLSKILQKKKFSLIIDETTDVSTSKSLALVARFYDESSEKVCDKFLALIKIENATANGIFAAISKCFEENKIPGNNLIGFGADNASTMMGNKSGVQQKLLEFNPDLYVLGCTCHSLNLCSSAACTKLPNAVEELTRDIYSYFSHSSKRIESFTEYQLFTETETHKILRPSQTRWLSLQSVVNRILEQWSALQLFFSNEALAENIKKAEHILAALNNNIFKIYFLFLSYILDIVNKLNVEFQTEGYTMHILLSKVTGMYKTVLKNFMHRDYVDKDMLHLDQISFHPASYLQLSEIYVGAKCELILLKQSVSDDELKKFKICCLDFYIQLCKEIKNRFKFHDPVLNFAKNLDPKVVTVSPAPIMPMYLKFNSTFQNLDVEKLSSEWRSIANNDVLLSHVNKPIEEFWTIVFEMRDLVGNLMYPNLTPFVQGFFALPHSSAAAERIFSSLNIIKTKNRNKLHISTCEALLHTKSLIPASCYNFEPSQHLISLNINSQLIDEDDANDIITF